MQLARVAVVDEAGATLLDVYVKPEAAVVDHLTAYSGVTAALLASASHSFAEAQAAVADLFADGAVFVAHSADSDLAALRLVHTRVLDTSVAYPHPSGLPRRFALRRLSSRFLDREIQAGHGSGGHNSTEDALAAMHLAQRLVYADCGAPAAAAADALRTAPPSAKRARKAESGGGGDDTFRAVFHRPPRNWCLPEESQPPAPPADAASAAAASAAGSRGIAAMVGLFAAANGGAGESPAATAPALEPAAPAPPAPAPAASPPMLTRPRGRAPAAVGPSLIAAATAAGGGVSVIGSHGFVAAHVRGAAAGIVCEPAPTAAAAARGLDAAAREAQRLVAASAAAAATVGGGGRGAGLGLVLAELHAPLVASGVPDWRALDTALTAAAFPAGTALVLVCQGSLADGGADGLTAATASALALDAANAPLLGALTAANPARFGMTFFTVAQSAAPRA